MYPHTSLLHFQKLTFLMLLFIGINGKAQIENIPISKEVTVDRLYIGLLTNTGLFDHTTDLHNFSSVQFGTRVRIALLPKRFYIRSFGVLTKTQGQTLQILRSYEAILIPSEKISIHLGVMATPTTEIRPNPTTWQSQIETNAEKTIIGGRPGIKFKYNFGEEFIVSYGIHNHDADLVNHLKVEYKQLVFSSFVDHNGVFIAAKWKFQNGNLLATGSRDTITFSTVMPIAPHYRFYADSAYSKALRKHTYFEMGLRRHFREDGPLKGFLSLGYNHPLKSVQGSFFIHI